MREITVGKNEAGQRLDKMLAKYLNQAPKSFLYKMMRKKNITLNGKKAQGNEMLAGGDVVCLYLAEETIEKFSGLVSVKRTAPLSILYEDDHVLLVNKPAGVLSQKADRNEESMVERVIGHCLKTGRLTEEELRLFRPSVCNRLDRNTSGILAAGISLPGLQEMTKLFRQRNVHKYYYCAVAGKIRGKKRIKGFLTKDGRTNRVSVSQNPISEESQAIETEYEPICQGEGITLMRVLLITGRSHQIRAHLQWEGCPIIGDTKYGNPAVNQIFREKYGVKNQLLHAGDLVFPQLTGILAPLSGRRITAPFPEEFVRVMEGEGLRV